MYIYCKQEVSENLCFLYSVEVGDPNTDTREDPESVMFPGGEVLVVRELKVKLIQEVPLKSVYTFTVTA